MIQKQNNGDVAATAIPGQSNAHPKKTNWRMSLVVLLLAACALIAYSNCYSVPYIFDDLTSIRDNQSIRHWQTTLAPNLKNGETVSGRPLLNASFAINYAISGADVWSYHAGNVLIHILAGLTLFGLIRRTLLLPGMRGRFGKDATLLAWIVAALWLAHPLGSEAVTYLVQRAESLVTLYYLLTLYCFLRALENSGSSRRWFVLSMVSCLAGMTAKEVMVSAPVMALCFDRTFAAGTFREALRLRGRWYAGLAATWAILILLMVESGARGNTVGYVEKSGITAWSYMLTQCWALVRYLQLSIWPHPLVFDYGKDVFRSLGEVWPHVVFVTGFVAASFWAFWKHPKAGWPGVFFLAVLAPTTTFVPIVTQVVAEHRMYLPLAAVIAGAVILGYRYLGRRIAWLAFPAVAIFMVTTINRNTDYRDPDTLWIDVVKKYPRNARALGNVGNALVEKGRFAEALPYFEKAMALQPDDGDNYNNIGYAYSQMHDYKKAVYYYDQVGVRNVSRMDVFCTNYSFALITQGRYEDAHYAAWRLLRVKPDAAESYVVAGDVFLAEKNYAGAEEHYMKALKMDGTVAVAWNNLGNIKALNRDTLEQALVCYKKAAEYAPDDGDIQDNAARLLLKLGRGQEALPYLAAQLKTQPAQNDTRKTYADMLYAAGRFEEAAAQYKLYLQRNPADEMYVGRQVVSLISSGALEQALPLARTLAEAAPGSHSSALMLANLLVMLGRDKESLEHFQVALNLAPERAIAAVRQNYAGALSTCGRFDEAIAQFKEAVKQAPHIPLIRHNFALTLERAGRVPEAIEQDQEALRLMPEFTDARANLERLQAQGKGTQSGAK
jgi:tetratricopeptide (TPR) repeat protein